MKTPNKKRFIALLLTPLLVVMLAIPKMIMGAETTVPLGTTASFAVLAGSTITNTGLTTIDGDAGGDIGLYPGTAFTGATDVTTTGITYLSDVAGVASLAKDDLVTAYNNAAGRTPDHPIIATLGGGTTLYPGVYNSGSSIQITGDLTLDAMGDPDAVFIFQAGSTLTTATGSRVKLSNGARYCRVFWQVGSSATLGTDSYFVGHILAMTSITANNGATVQGQLLARDGAVTLDTNTITNGICDSILRVTIQWGDMTFNYDFGTWDPDAHQWGGGSGWNTSEFDGNKDRVKVTNYSLQPICATFSYEADPTDGDSATGTFTKASGNLNGDPTGTMELIACPVDATAETAPSDNTYFNLQGAPGSIIPTVQKMGTIVVTIYSD